MAWRDGAGAADGGFGDGFGDGADWLAGQFGASAPEAPAAPVAPAAPAPAAPQYAPDPFAQGHDPFAPPAAPSFTTPPAAAPAPAPEPVRRHEEVADWFSLAEPVVKPAPVEPDASTRALPVVGSADVSGYAPAAPSPVPAPTWTSEPEPVAWTPPPAPEPAAWTPPPAPEPDPAPAPAPAPGPSFSWTQAPVPDQWAPQTPVVAANDPFAAPAPGPVTPTAPFALTWGDGALDSEAAIRAAFAQLSAPARPSEPAQSFEPVPPVAMEPVQPVRPASSAEPTYPAEPVAEPEPLDPWVASRYAEAQSEAPAFQPAPLLPPDPDPEVSPFEGFTPPPVARQSFTPLPEGGAASAPRQTDFGAELWSAISEPELEVRGPAAAPETVPAEPVGGFAAAEPERKAESEVLQRPRAPFPAFASVRWDEPDEPTGTQVPGAAMPPAVVPPAAVAPAEPVDDLLAALAGGPRAVPPAPVDPPTPTPPSGFGFDDRLDVEQPAFDAGPVLESPVAEVRADDEFGSAFGALGLVGGPVEAPVDVPPAPRVRAWSAVDAQTTPAVDDPFADDDFDDEGEESVFLWRLVPDPDAPDPKVDPAAAAALAAAAAAVQPPVAGEGGAWSLDGAFEDDDTHADDLGATAALDLPPLGAPDHDPWFDEREPAPTALLEQPRRHAQAGASDPDDPFAVFFGAADPTPAAVPLAGASALGAVNRAGSDAPTGGFPAGPGPVRGRSAGDGPSSGDASGSGGSGSNGSGGNGGGSGRGGLPRPLLWIAGALVVLVVLAGLFYVGTRLTGGDKASPTGSPASTTTDAATETPTPEPTAPQPAGVHAWDTLFGGECLDPFTDPWAEEFTVVDCAAPHAAQLVYRGTLAYDAAAAFPGEADLGAQMATLCRAPGVIDVAAAAGAPDLQVQGTFPVTEEQWAAGMRTFYCFVNRAGGEPITGTLQGPGPTA
ncbi:hypothetical protein ET445_05045 [Agromyces protaetiae]|uniref:Septum formation-related domain-containing protein n=1 Tax=Agromyces protaetiae TaxID=2509455 RepID=A0A4P6FCV9_9MICO|nr:septum formation family protein [Agromyces protaetiae]QAY72803.1 hypothetical protein ET445_05045 [Agromyces protaetiae]